MNQCPSTEQLQRLLAEQLPGAERDTLEDHVESCSVCQTLLERLVASEGGAGRRTGSDLAPGQYPDSGFVKRLKNMPPWQL